mgnify:FL=1
MAVLSFNIKGLDATLKGVDNKLKQVEQELQDELNAWASLCSTEAKIRAPKDEGHLAGSINPKFGKLEASVTVAVFYAAYVEFGTGVHVRKDLPNDWITYARKFYINGKGRTRAHPYLFPAYEHTVNDLKKNLKTLFK